MAAVEHIAGEDDPFETGTVWENGAADRCVVTVKGKLSDLESEEASDHVPSDYELDSYTITPDGDGFGTMAIRCVKPGSSDVSTTPDSETWSIDMLEVQYDLINHPGIAPVRAVLRHWIATDEEIRVKEENNETKYYWGKDENDLHEITQEIAKKFCATYLSGITTYVRYFPVVEHVSTYKRLPGASMNGKSTTSGTAKFSDKIGQFDDPAILLQNYGSGHWFKSGDRYVQNADQSWTRTEQWTYTPETADSDHGWIYANLVAPATEGGNSNGGGNSAS